MPDNVAETTPGLNECSAPLLTTARLCLDALPEAPSDGGQIDPKLNDYRFDRMEIISTFAYWIFLTG